MTTPAQPAEGVEALHVRLAGLACMVEKRGYPENAGLIREAVRTLAASKADSARVHGWVLHTGHCDAYHHGAEPPKSELPDAWRPVYATPQPEGGRGEAEGVPFCPRCCAHPDATPTDAARVRDAEDARRWRMWRDDTFIDRVDLAALPNEEMQAAVDAAINAADAALDTPPAARRGEE